MILFIRCMSIAGNVVFVLFVGFLISDEAGTLRWVHHLNQFWFLLVVIAAIVLAAILAEWSENRRSKITEPGREGGSLRPAA
jgi:hypothetical protein